MSSVILSFLKVSLDRNKELVNLRQASREEGRKQNTGWWWQRVKEGGRFQAEWGGSQLLYLKSLHLDISWVFTCQACARHGRFKGELDVMPGSANSHWPKSQVSQTRSSLPCSLLPLALCKAGAPSAPTIQIVPVRGKAPDPLFPEAHYSHTAPVTPFSGLP